MHSVPCLRSYWQARCTSFLTDTAASRSFRCISMAGVEAQLLSLIFSAADVPLRTAAIGFAILALLSTAFVALYCAVTHIWLSQEWRHKAHCFHEWVAGSVPMMLVWCSVSLVIGACSCG